MNIDYRIERKWDGPYVRYSVPIAGERLEAYFQTGGVLQPSDFDSVAKVALRLELDDAVRSYLRDKRQPVQAVARQPWGIILKAIWRKLRGAQ